eukprot:609616-Rhodomonas_salina.1
MSSSEKTGDFSLHVPKTYAELIKAGMSEKEAWESIKSEVRKGLLANCFTIMADAIWVFSAELQDSSIGSLIPSVQAPQPAGAPSPEPAVRRTLRHWLNAVASPAPVSPAPNTRNG